MNPLFLFAYRLTRHRTFQALVFFFILLSAIVVGLETYPGLVSRYHEIMAFTDRLIIIFFTLEISLKILSHGNKPWQYFADPWNVFDFVVVAICLIPAKDTHFFAVLRILRILRILRMISFFPKLRLLIGALLKSIPSMGYVILLLTLLFFVYAIIGVFVFGPADPLHFSDLHHAMITLFKVLTLEGWTDIMNLHIYGNAPEGTIQIVSAMPFFYFASFILIGAMIIMNLFIGVIMNSMEESQKEVERELQEIRYQGAGSEELYRHILSKLEELKAEIHQLTSPGNR